MVTSNIITIGDEILIGHIVDTNSAFIGKRFSEIGVKVIQIISIGDDCKQIIDTVDKSLRTADITIITGGIGPTKDDITKSSLVKLFKSELVRDEKAYNHIERMLYERNIEFNTLNQSQADVPECCVVIENSNGTAPCMMFERDGNILFCLPGVSYEMHELIVKSIIPIIKSRYKLKSIIHKTIKTYGLPESILSEKIALWENSLPSWIKLAYLPNPNFIRLRLSAYDVDKNEAEQEMYNMLEQLSLIIPNNILGDEFVTLESSIAKLLSSKNLTLSTAESCTGGRIASRITLIDGASSFYLGSVVAYSNHIKQEILSVNSNLLEQYGAVSEQVVEQMAIGVRLLTGSDYALATSGIAGPTGGSDEKPVGMVWVALATPNKVISKCKRFGKLREQNIEKASSYALNMLREELLGL